MHWPMYPRAFSLTHCLSQYKIFTDTIRDSSKSYTNSIDRSFEGLADFVTGAALTSGAKFPFVSVPMFEVQGEHARQVSGIEALTFAPLVAEQSRKEWEEFAWENQGWVEEGRDISLSGVDVLQRSGHIIAPITDFIYQRESLEPPYAQIPAVDAPFLPAWHVSLSRLCSCCLQDLSSTLSPSPFLPL